MRVGFLGLGIMGRPMALNLLAAGIDLSVHARRAESMTPLVEAGARACASPAALAAECDILITMVSDTIDVEQVILGDGGLVEGLRPGCLVIDMSTISPSATRRIAERLAEDRVAMLDAPVSGGDLGAKAGTLSIMVGGPDEAFERARGLFDIMGGNVVHVGGNGAGQVCKACNQVVVGGTIAAVAEALTLAEASAVDASKVREALLGGFANSRILEMHGQRMIDRGYAPGFKAKLHQKDMRILSEAAHELGLPMPTAAQVHQYLNALVGRGDGELDSAAICEVLRSMAPPREG